MAVTEREVTRTPAAAAERPPDYPQGQGLTPATSQPVSGEQDDGTTAARFRRAQARVEELRGFYIHGFMYVLVNAALLGINLVTSSGYLWFLWVTIGWGVGLASHAFVVFGVAGLLGKQWEDRKIREIMERDEHS